METLIKALAEIQSEVKVNKELKNNFGNYNYRNVEMILAEVKPLLAKHNLILTLRDEIVSAANRVYVRATATITDGKNVVETTAFAREDESKRGMDLAQLTGSCSSYARKYALGGLLLLDDNKDIDSLDNTQTQSKQVASSGAKTKANADLELQKAKNQLFEELQSAGIDKSQMKAFVDWAGINASTLQGVREALGVDLQSLASEFFAKKEQEASSAF